MIIFSKKTEFFPIEKISFAYTKNSVFHERKNLLILTQKNNFFQTKKLLTAACDNFQTKENSCNYQKFFFFQTEKLLYFSRNFLYLRVKKLISLQSASF